MTPFENAYYYSLGLAYFNLNQLKQENEMLKTTAGMTAPMPACNFLPPERIQNIGPKRLFSDCFEVVKPPKDSDYKLGYIDGWVDCADYFISQRKEKDWNEN